MDDIQLASKNDIQLLNTRVTALEQSGGGGEFMLPHFTVKSTTSSSQNSIYSRTGKGILRFFYMLPSNNGSSGYILVDPDGKGSTATADYKIPLTISKAQNSSQNFVPIIGSAISWIGLPNNNTTIENSWAGVVFEIPYKNSINLTIYNGTGTTVTRVFINDMYAE